MTMTTQPYCGFANIQELVADTAALFADAIEVPNEWVPPRYRHKSGMVGMVLCSKVEKIYKREVASKVEENSHEQERARRIALYAERFANDGKIEYEPFVHGVPKSRKQKQKTL